MAYILSALVIGAMLACSTYDYEYMTSTGKINATNCEVILEEKISVYQKERTQTRIIAILMMISLCVVTVIAATITAVVLSTKFPS